MHQHPDFHQLYIADHPLIAHKLTHMRDVTTSTKTFRRLLHEIALLMGYEITRDLPTTHKQVHTPLATIDTAPIIDGKKVAVVPILRAGLGMAEGLLELMPSARIGHIGVYRDPKTKQAVRYMVKLPDPSNRSFIVVDPMLATGNSMNCALDLLQEHVVAPEHTRIMCLVAAPEGVRAVRAQHPDIAIYTAALDDHLDANAYIVPGLGDAGDRLFGTK